MNHAQDARATFKLHHYRYTGVVYSNYSYELETGGQRINQAGRVHEHFEWQGIYLTGKTARLCVMRPTRYRVVLTSLTPTVSVSATLPIAHAATDEVSTTSR